MKRQHKAAEEFLGHLEPLMLMAYRAKWRIPRGRSEKSEGPVRRGRR
jgi:hypothetical protein